MNRKRLAVDREAETFPLANESIVLVRNLVEVARVFRGTMQSYSLAVKAIEIETGGDGLFPGSVFRARYVPGASVPIALKWNSNRLSRPRILFQMSRTRLRSA